MVHADRILRIGRRLPLRSIAPCIRLRLDQPGSSFAGRL